MANVPNVFGEGGEGPAHVEEGERQGDHVHLLHGVGARARDISLQTPNIPSSSVVNPDPDSIGSLESGSEYGIRNPNPDPGGQK
jgi:hypothetical protein